MIDQETERAIVETLHSYIADRDAMSAAANNAGGGVFTPGSGKGLSAIIRFTEMNKLHANTLMRELPNLNLAEMQAVTELLNVALNEMRLRLVK